jgi:uncharacterized membrane protein YvlD (DUF360 family)
MKALTRFGADAIAVFLALYLLDSVAGGRFVLNGVWAAVIFAVVLGFLNSLIRPLHRVRSKPFYGTAVTVGTVLVNALVVQLLAWGDALAVRNVGWVFLAALFVTVVTSTINWLIGFGGRDRARPRASAVAEAKAGDDRRKHLPRSGRERLS